LTVAQSVTGAVLPDPPTPPPRPIATSVRRVVGQRVFSCPDAAVDPGAEIAFVAVVFELVMFRHGQSWESVHKNPYPGKTNGCRELSGKARAHGGSNTRSGVSGALSCGAGLGVSFCLICAAPKLRHTRRPNSSSFRTTGQSGPIAGLLLMVPWCSTRSLHRGHALLHGSHNGAGFLSPVAARTGRPFESLCLHYVSFAVRAMPHLVRVWLGVFSLRTIFSGLFGSRLFETGASGLLRNWRRVLVVIFPGLLACVPRPSC